MEVDISYFLQLGNFSLLGNRKYFSNFHSGNFVTFILTFQNENQPFLIQICSLDVYPRGSGAIKISSISKIYEFDVSHPLLVYIYITSKLVLSMMRTISTQSCYFKKYMASQKNIWTLFYIRKFYLAPACTFGWVNIP